MKPPLFARSAESKADAPDTGWAKESVCEGADCIATAGDRGLLPCEAKDVLDDVQRLFSLR